MVIRLTAAGLCITLAVAIARAAETTSLDTALKMALVAAVAFVAGALYVLDKVHNK